LRKGIKRETWDDIVFSESELSRTTRTLKKAWGAFKGPFE
jgi:hypothetical protein